MTTTHATDVRDCTKAINRKKKTIAYGDIFVATETTGTKKLRHKQVRDSSDYTSIKKLYTSRVN